MAYANKVIRNTKTSQGIRFVQTAKETGGQLLEMESSFAPILPDLLHIIIPTRKNTLPFWKAN